MKTLSVSFATLLALSIASFTPAAAQLLSRPEEAGRLRMTQTGGSNGAAVVYDPNERLYYAAYAGNSSFPLEAFKDNDLLQPVYQTTTMIDLRGLWYNPRQKALEADSYGEEEIIRYERSSKGQPESYQTELKGNQKPDAQSVAAFDGNGQYLLYLGPEGVMRYSRSSGRAVGKVSLKPFDFDAVNQTTLLYFGQNEATYGVLVPNRREIICFNQKGKQVATISLPPNCPMPQMFNISYANKRVWVLDQNRREWIGYQIFK